MTPRRRPGGRVGHLTECGHAGRRAPLPDPLLERCGGETAHRPAPPDRTRGPRRPDRRPRSHRPPRRLLHRPRGAVPPVRGLLGAVRARPARPAQGPGRPHRAAAPRRGPRRRRDRAGGPAPYQHRLLPLRLGRAGQSAGISPYDHAPQDPGPSRLRDPWLFPTGAACAGPDRAPIPGGGPVPHCTRINRPAVHTIYPPVAEAYFLAVDRLSPAGARHKPLQIGSRPPLPRRDGRAAADPAPPGPGPAPRRVLGLVSRRTDRSREQRARGRPGRAARRDRPRSRRGARARPPGGGRPGPRRRRRHQTHARRGPARRTVRGAPGPRRGRRPGPRRRLHPARLPALRPALARLRPRLPRRLRGRGGLRRPLHAAPATPCSASSCPTAGRSRCSSPPWRACPCT